MTTRAATPSQPPAPPFPRRPPHRGPRRWGPITEIAQRTGLAQSLVSRTVDRLQTHGVLTAARDPADGRRTLVSVNPQTRHLDLAERAERPIADAIRQVAGVSGDRIEAALEALGDELFPRSR